MSDHRNDPALIAAGEEAGLVVPCLRRCHAVAAPLQYDGWHTDRWLRHQPPLDVFEIRVARSVTETMAVGMDDNVDEIRIFEGRGRALVGRIIEFPIRRPELPQELAELAAIGGQSRPAPFGVKVVLVP